MKSYSPLRQQHKVCIAYPKKNSIRLSGRNYFTPLDSSNYGKQFASDAETTEHTRQRKGTCTGSSAKTNETDALPVYGIDGRLANQKIG
jgi:hypothetical protein